MNRKRKYRIWILWCLGLDLLVIGCMGYRYLDRRIPDEIHVQKEQEIKLEQILEHPLLTFEGCSFSLRNRKLYDRMQYYGSDPI